MPDNCITEDKFIETLAPQLSPADMVRARALFRAYGPEYCYGVTDALCHAADTGSTNEALTMLERNWREHHQYLHERTRAADPTNRLLQKIRNGESALRLDWAA
jgi:hypothetical protein